MTASVNHETKVGLTWGWVCSCGRSQFGFGSAPDAADSAAEHEAQPCNAAQSTFHCNRPAGHDGQHGYAGVFW